MTEEKTMATKQWRKEFLTFYKFYFHKELDRDVLEWFEKQPNKRQYIIELIRADMQKKEA